MARPTSSSAKKKARSAKDVSHGLYAMLHLVAETPIVRPMFASFGIVLPALEQLRSLVQACAKSPLIIGMDFTFSAPIYKGSERIRMGLSAAEGAMARFDVYFRCALLDEKERLRFGGLFQTRHLAKYPQANPQQILDASGNVFQVAFEFSSPEKLDEADLVLDVIQRGKHDPEMLSNVFLGAEIERPHRVITIRPLLLDLFNRPRHEHAAVQRAIALLGTDMPCVLEATTTTALPAYLEWGLAPLVSRVGGRLVSFDPTT